MQFFHVYHMRLEGQRNSKRWEMAEKYYKPHL
jgi:hypothetical protein